MDKLNYERADYSVVVKNRAPPPKAWRWEIYRGVRHGQLRHPAEVIEPQPECYT
jgi:hypothetical protein